MAKYVTVVSRDGQELRMSLDRVRALPDTAGQWRDGVYHFNFARRADTHSTVRHSPQIGRITSRLVDQYDGGDTGWNFLRYPMKTGESGGFAAQFPALARRGAGL